MVVRAFLHWMQVAPAEQRTLAAGALARAWLESDLSESEREDAEAALVVLLDDPAPSVRRAMADALADSDIAPRHVILGLASDRPDIATVVLRRSPVLLDVELIDLVATCEPAYQVAIASRTPMSDALAAAIAEVGCVESCLALLDDPERHPGFHALRRVADRHGDDPVLRQALLDRPDLPVAVRQALISRLGSALNGLVTARAWMRRERSERMVREACDKATTELAAGTGDDDMDGLVRHLRDSAQLTTSLMLRALCAGNLRFFEAALSVLSGVPAERVYALISEGRKAGLRALYQKAGLPAATFPAFSVALDVFRDMDFDGEGGDIARFSRRMIERVLDRSGDFTPGETDQLIVLLRRFETEAARDAAREFVEATVAA